METAEKPENQLGDAAEVTIKGSEQEMSRDQQTEVAFGDDGIKSNGSLDDAQIPDKKAFLDPNWVQSFKRRLCEESGHTPSKFFISRVPDRLRQLDEKAYTPQLISIGPFHYDKRSTHLKAMEKHKWRYLNENVARIGQDCLERFMVEIKLLEGIARSCYSEKTDYLDSNSFVEMMVLDGCFIIELFLKTYIGENDPILDLKGQRERIAIDLLKLENQIPLVILQHLYDLMAVYTPSLQQMALSFFNFFQQNYQKPCRRFSHIHLLHLLHASLRPHCMKMVSTKDEVKMTHAASKLVYGGIKIKKGTADTFLEIGFQKEKAVIKIPTFSAEENIVPVLFNLVALEHTNSFPSYFTEYIVFMDRLIGSAADVKFLCEKGIIENKLGSNEQVGELFKNITSNITFHRDKFYLVNVLNDIDQCYGNGWRILRARFKHNWSLISCSCSSQSSFIPCVQLCVKK